VTYVFQFGIVFDRFPELLEGALLTIRLAALAMVFGLIVALDQPMSEIMKINQQPLIELRDSMAKPV